MRQINGFVLQRDYMVDVFVISLTQEELSLTVPKKMRLVVRRNQWQLQYLYSTDLRDLSHLKLTSNVF